MLKIGSEVIYNVNSCIFIVKSLDKNSDNLTIESEFERYSSVSKDDITLLR